MILAGRITVNRMPAEIGQKVSPGDEVRINGELVKVRFAEPRPRILMYHKPAGELVTRDDPEGRPTVFEKLPSIGNGKWINVGRLDYNTEGLLLFTNSGELANRMMHPRYEVEREYAVRVMGRLTDEQMKALTQGVQLDDGVARCVGVEDAGGDEEGSNHWYKVVLKEGRNREVRRIFEALSLMVSRLIRTRFGPVAMPARVKRGDLLELEPGEVTAVLQSAGMNGAGRQPQSQGQARPQQRGMKQKGPRRHGARGNGVGPRPEIGKTRLNGQGDVAPAIDDAGAPTSEAQPQVTNMQQQPRPNGPRPPRKFGKPGQRPHGKGPRHGNAPPQNHQQQRPPRAHNNFDEVQPLSNANASPFVSTTLSVPGNAHRGGHASQGHGSQRSGPRAKRWGAGAQPGQGQPGGGQRGNKPPHRGPKPFREVDGNVAPRGEQQRPTPIDDDE